MAADLERFRRTFSQTFATGPSLKLRVENQNGPISIHGTDQDQVVVTVVAELWAESASHADLEQERILRGVTLGEGILNIRTPELLKPSGGLLGWSFSQGPKVDYEASVPRQTSVTVDSRNSKIDIRSVRGPAQVDAKSGSITLSEISQEVVVKGRNGSVKINGAGASVTVASKNGSIVVEEANGEVSTEAANGSTEIVNPGGAVQAETANGSVRFRGQVLGPVKIGTRNGSIRLAVPKDSRFELDANSVRGSVRSDLEVRKGNATSDAPTPRHLVQLKSENGSIRIEELAGASSPAGSSSRFAEPAPETPPDQQSS